PLGVARAHFVGHSYGGAVAPPPAPHRPGLVHPPAPLEPPPMVGAGGQGGREAAGRGGARHPGAGAARAVDAFLEARWPGYRDPLERALPGALAQAVADAATAFEREVPALLGWRFGEEEARRIGQPVLSVLGGESTALWARFGEAHEMLLD